MCSGRSKLREKRGHGNRNCCSGLISALERAADRILLHQQSMCVQSLAVVLISILSVCVKNCLPGICYIHLTIGHILLQESYIAFLRKTLSKLQLVYRNWGFMQGHTMPIWNQKIRPRFIEDGQPVKFRFSILSSTGA